MKESKPPVEEVKGEEATCSERACHNCFENSGCMYYQNSIVNNYTGQVNTNALNETARDQPVFIY